MALNRMSLDETYLHMVRCFALRSTCWRRKVAAVFVDIHGQVLSIGYNGVPRGMNHCTEHPCEGAEDQHGDNSRCMAVHAEVNAALQCPNVERVHTIYCSCIPCFECAKMICNFKYVDRIVVIERYADERGVKLLEGAGIKLVIADTFRFTV